ncbi:uncharacterized protein LOC109854000 isoform X2 [Pseudomyrmex gracilis]|nr:uncharacterized protein LOC109854000 isoform X2 [Pseudomyrmex gracilis]
MSGLEDQQNATEENDTPEETIEEARTSNEATSPSEESNSSDLSESISARNTEEEREEIDKREEQEETDRKEQEEIDEEEERKKTQNDETSESELATVTKSTSSGDGVIALRQTEPDESRVEPISSATVVDNGNAQHQQQQQQQQRHNNGSNVAAVGEWNSLPVLVERLRKALELSLAVSYRRGDESTTTPSAEPVVGTDNERGGGGGGGDRVYARCCSMEQALLGGDDCDSELKKNELKFLEDLLLSDIQTALSRLRETLERTNVETLAKYGGASNPTSKLQLLRLVSSLLSRLQVPEKKAEGSENKTGTARIGGIMPFEQKRRAVRHTIGVSAEEIAHARRQLEESNANLAKLNDQMQLIQKQEPLPSAPPYAMSSSEKYVEEVHDKYTKDAINQRQSLRDKNKDSYGDTSVYRPLIPTQIVDHPIATEPGDSNACQTRRRSSVDSCQENAIDDEQTAMRKAKEEQNRVASLANALRQRADAVSANRCNNNNNNNNKFTAKKSKIKRANTIDIPSYLKLQTENLGYDGTGCVSLRRPINVSDKIVSNPSLVIPPSFQPRTENDKKFLALINRNNETQTFTTAPAFIKSFGYTKTADASSMSENWNSRFSNIKTAFDKPMMNDGNKPTSPNPHPAKRLPVAQIFENQKASGDTTTVHNGFRNVPKPDVGFRHAPSSLFQKIEKSQNPKSPPSQQRQRNNAPFGSTVREKARTTFERDNSGGGGIRSQPLSKCDVNENSQKSTFSRPPWIEHDRNERKPMKMVTENGRLDYRQFCKQFAPFIASKNAVPESKRSPQNILEHSKARGKNFVAPRDNKLDLMDGKISFKVTPERDSQIRQQHRLGDLRPEIEELNRDRFSCGNKSITVDNDKNLLKSAIDVTFKSNSSVVTQIGANNVSPPEEMRVYQAVSSVSRNPLRAQNNASVQTNREPEMEQGTAFRYERANNNNPTLESIFYPENSEQFVLDYNQNYRSPTEIILRNETSPSANVSVHSPIGNVPVQATSDYSLKKGEQIFPPISPQNYLPPKSTIDTRRLETYQDHPPYIAFANQEVSFENHVSDEIGQENYERTSDALPEEQNIQNQDISTDVGVVTRYACAIATVASAENVLPKTRIEEDDTEYKASLSTSPSSQLWSCPKLTTDSEEVTTTEDEIRRHNILQQNLVCRLQNERATLNDYHNTIVSNQSAGFGQIDHTCNRSGIDQAVKYEKSANRMEAGPKQAELKKLEPPIVTNLLAPPSSSGFGANRVIALREQYEQPSALSHSKSSQKERSPIPTGTSDTMDSSDKYLVSCASKPFRSIVLSKSESWHQLALTKKQSAVLPRPSHGGLLPQSSSLLSSITGGASYSPKPPKPKSTLSSFRLKKQYEASSSLDSVKKMEDKIRRYFDTPAPCDHDTKNRRFSSCNPPAKGMLGLSRSRTMPGICNERLRLSIPAPTSPQIPTTNLNSAEVDRVFEDIFEEATRADSH